MAKYVKLSNEASQGNFYDPTLKLKILPGKVVELPNNFRTSKKTVKALQGGHLVYTTKSGKDDDDSDNDNDPKFIDLTKLSNKKKLSQYIIDNSEHYDSIDELKDDNSKAELLSLAQEIQDNL